VLNPSDGGCTKRWEMCIFLVTSLCHLKSKARPAAVSKTMQPSRSSIPLVILYFLLRMTGCFVVLLLRRLGRSVIKQPRKKSHAQQDMA